MSESRLQRTIGRAGLLIVALVIFIYALSLSADRIDGFLRPFAFHLSLVLFSLVTKPWAVIRDSAGWWPGGNQHNHYGAGAIAVGSLAAFGLTFGFFMIILGSIGPFLPRQVPWVLPAGILLSAGSLSLIRPVQWFLRKAHELDRTHAT